MSRILLVDDHPLLREGIGRLLATDPEVEMAGSASTVQEALALADRLAPDLVVTDLSLPGRNGLELIKDLGAAHPEIPVIVYSMHDELVYAERVLRAGGRGYVMKNAAPESLLAAVHSVLEGGVFASAAITDHFLKSFATGHAAAEPMVALERLTDREMEIFELIGHAKSTHEIVCQLGISPRTFDAHRAHIRDKLGLKSGKELIREAIRWVEGGMANC